MAGRVCQVPAAQSVELVLLVSKPEQRRHRVRAEPPSFAPEFSSNIAHGACVPGVCSIANGRHRRRQSCSSSTAYQSLCSSPQRLPRILLRRPHHPHHRHRRHRRRLHPHNRCRRRRFPRRRHLRRGWRCMQRMLAVQSTCRRWSSWRSSLGCCVASFALRAACAAAADAHGIRLRGARVG